jgi:subtilisin family serine protease
MGNKFLILHVLALMLCACLPMTPVMAAGIDAVTYGRIADLGAGYSHADSSDLPVLSSTSPRWDLLQIKAPEAWRVVEGGKNVIVAVLDTGIDAEHKDLRGKILGSVAFTASSGLDADRGHGTHIAGVIAGSDDNATNVGLAYHCSLLDVRVAENDGTTDAKKVSQGIIWAVDHGADIINISIVFNKTYPLMEYAVDYAWKHGCLVIAAAGNTDTEKAVYPAAYPHVIGVAATDRNDGLAKWSNRGDWVTVAAPGVDIYSTLPNNGFGYKSGTSFSTALVSGEAALLYSRAADMNGNGKVNDEVSNAIVSNFDKSGNQDQSVRRINVYKAAMAVQLNDSLR